MNKIMRVMCINDNWIEDINCHDLPRPKFMDIDEVIDECWDRIEYYELSRFPNVLFSTNNFIPLSSIDETELIKERDKILMKL